MLAYGFGVYTNVGAVVWFALGCLRSCQVASGTVGYRRRPWRPGQPKKCVNVPESCSHGLGRIVKACC